MNASRDHQKSQNNNSKHSQLGQLLVDKCLITRGQLEWALKQQAESGLKLGELLVREKLISRVELTRVLCRQRWLRSAVASLVMAAMPVCPVLASEKDGTIDFNKHTKVLWGEGDSDVRLDFSPLASNLKFDVDNKKHSFKVGIQHAFSGGGMEFSVNRSQFTNTQIFSPQISLFTSGNSTSKRSSLSFKLPKGIKRFDRYKDTIPAVYRLTLKGYSLYENDSKTVETWGMNKIRNHPCKDYELMFSITKQF